MAGGRSGCGQPRAPGQADRNESRALWPPAQTHAAEADQGLARGKGAAVLGERSKAARNQACNEREGVTRRQLKRVTND